MNTTEVVTKELVRRHARLEVDQNDLETLYGYCDVLAVAEIIYALMCPTSNGLKAITVSIADIADVVEAVLMDESRQTEPFKVAFCDENGSVDTSAVATRERLEIVAYSCQYMVEVGWLQRPGSVEGFPRDFGGSLEKEKEELVLPEYELLRVLRYRFEDAA